MIKSSADSYRIETINAGHDRTRFDCGHPFLNIYLAQFARQNDRKGWARAYVLVPEPDGNPVVGYYTLTAGAVAFEEVPADLRSRIPKYPIPVARIGELAVNTTQRGEGLGSDLLLDAITRITRASDEVAVWAIVVDPIDLQATSFYTHHGFQVLTDCDSMILPMKTAKAWLQENN